MEIFGVQLALQGNTEPTDPVVFQPWDVGGIITAEFFIIKSGKSSFCGNPTITIVVEFYMKNTILQKAIIGGIMSDYVIRGLGKAGGDHEEKQ